MKNLSLQMPSFGDFPRTFWDLASYSTDSTLSRCTVGQMTPDVSICFKIQQFGDFQDLSSNWRIVLMFSLGGGEQLVQSRTWKGSGLLLGRKVALCSMHLSQSLMLTLSEAE